MTKDNISSYYALLSQRIQVKHRLSQSLKKLGWANQTNASTVNKDDARLHAGPRQASSLAEDDAQLL